MRTILQGVAFALVARALGPTDLGIFAAIFSISSLVAPFARLGAHDMVTYEVTRGTDVSVAARQSLQLSLRILAPATLLVTALSMVVIGTRHVAAALVIAGSTMLMGAVRDVVAASLLIDQRARGVAAIESGRGILYFTAATVLFMWSTGGLLAWATMYAIHAIATAAGAWAAYAPRTQAGQGGAAHGRPATPRRLVRSGVLFAVGRSAEVGYTNIDQAVMPRYVPTVDVGAYAGAARVVGIGTAIIGGVVDVLRPRLFRIAADSSASSSWRSREVARLLTGTAALGLVGSVAVFLLSPLAIVALGEDFAQTAGMLRWLSPVVFLRSLQLPMLSLLTGGGRQGRRTILQLAALGANLGLNIAFLERVGWVAAALSTLACEAGLVVSLYVMLRMESRTC